jgi:hypothetical protein
MSQSQRTRIARLEGRVRLYLAEREQASDSEGDLDEDGYLNSDTFNALLRHAVNLAYLIRFGDPKIGEPLSEAWKRTGYNGKYHPFEYIGAEMVCADLRSNVFPSLPGTSLKEKLDLIFESAPAWVIWFANGESTAYILGLKLPRDLLSVVKFARPRGRWPSLPSDAFEPRLWPESRLWPDPRLRGDQSSHRRLEDYFMRQAGLLDTSTSRRQRARSRDMEPPPPPPIRWPDAP